MAVSEVFVASVHGPGGTAEVGGRRRVKTDRFAAMPVRLSLSGRTISRRRGIFGPPAAELAAYLTQALRLSHGSHPR